MLVIMGAEAPVEIGASLVRIRAEQLEKCPRKAKVVVPTARIHLPLLVVLKVLPVAMRSLL